MVGRTNLISKIFSGILLVYIAWSLWISFAVQSIVSDTYNSLGRYDDSLKGIVSMEQFKQLDYRTKTLDANLKNVKEETTRSFPVSMHSFTKAKVKYSYSHFVQSKSKGDKRTGSSKAQVEVNVKLKNWKWVVVDVKEHS